MTESLRAVLLLAFVACPASPFKLRSSATLQMGMSHVQLGDGPEEYVPHDSTHPEALYIPIIRGGLGDSLRQLMQAIMFAESHNLSVVDVTAQAYNKHFQGFLSIAEDRSRRRDRGGFLHPLRVEPLPPANRTSVTCTLGTTEFDVHKATMAFYCNHVSPEDWQRVLRKYIQPILVPEAAVDHKRRNNELVIHMRSGDAMTTTSGLASLEVHQPPCSFYDKVIEGGVNGAQFKNIRIVTQNDTLNPCVREIQDRHPSLNVVVQHSSLAEDGAALLHARHLVLAQSYFSIVIAQMSTQVETVFYAKTTQMDATYDGGPVPCGHPGQPTVVEMQVEGIMEERSDLHERQYWMRSCPASKVSTTRTCKAEQS